MPGATSAPMLSATTVMPRAVRYSVERSVRRLGITTTAAGRSAAQARAAASGCASASPYVMSVWPSLCSSRARPSTKSLSRRPNGTLYVGSTTRSVRPRRSERASERGSYPRSRAMSRTRRRVSSGMRASAVSFMAYETVARETPAARATSAPVTAPKTGRVLSARSAPSAAGAGAASGASAG